MRKNLMKALALVLACVLVLSLAGCKKTEDSSANNGGTTNSGTTKNDEKKDDSSKTASNDVVTIRLYRDTFNLNAVDPDGDKAVADAINEYLLSQGAKVQIELHDIQNAEYPEKANLALSGKEVDLLWTASWIDTIKCDNLVKRNASYDISNLLPGTKLYSSMPEWVWKASQYDGKDYFISCYKESAEGYDLLTRTDLVNKYGWDLSKVKTLKELEPMLEQCKNDGIRYPFLTQKTAMFYRWYLNDFDFVLQNSMVAVDRAKNEVVNVITTPQYKEFVKLMCSWADKGYISEDEATKTTPDATTQTQDWGISWWTCVPNDEEADDRYKQSVETYEFTNKYSHSTTTLGSCFTISSACSEDTAKACIEFLGYLFTDSKVANLYTYGIEGTDYDVNADGRIVKKGEKYNHGCWESTSVTAVSLLEPSEPANKIELYEKFNSAAQSSIASGFRFDKTNVEAEWTTCMDIYEKYGYVLENGGYTEAEVDAMIDAYVAELNGAGFQKVIDELTKQYNDWKK